MSANYVEGKDLMLFTGTSTKKPIALATDCKLTISHAVKDISSKDSGIWSDLSQGKMKWTATTDALLSFDASIQSYEYFYDLLLAREKLTITFAAAGGTIPDWTVSSAESQYTGTVYITSLDLNAKDGDAASYSVQFEGTGPLTKTAGV